MNGYWHVRDLGSRNGIKVNGIRCDAHWLMPGDVISVSKHRFEVNYSPTGDAPPAELEPDPMSISLLEKAGLSHRGIPNPGGFAKTSPDLRRDVTPPRHSLDANPRRIDDDDDDLDDDKLVWLDK